MYFMHKIIPYGIMCNSKIWETILVSTQRELIE